MTKTRIQNQRPAAKGRHQKPNTRWSVRENPPNGVNWGGKVWPGTGPGVIPPVAQWLFDPGIAAAGIASGDVRFNNATLASITHVFVSKTGMTGSDPTGTWAVNDPLRVYDATDLNRLIEFKITAISSQTGYFDYTVTVTGTLGGFTLPADNAPLFLTERTSVPGSDPQTPPIGGPIFDPGTMTVDEVKAEIDALTLTGDELRAAIQGVLDAERANKNRSTLTDWLDAKLGVV